MLVYAIQFRYQDVHTTPESQKSSHTCTVQRTVQPDFVCVVASAHKVDSAKCLQTVELHSISDSSSDGAMFNNARRHHTHDPQTHVPLQVFSHIHTHFCLRPGRVDTSETPRTEDIATVALSPSYNATYDTTHATAIRGAQTQKRTHTHESGARCRY